MFVMCGVTTTLQVAFHCNISDPKPILNAANKHQYLCSQITLRESVKADMMMGLLDLAQLSQSGRQSS